MADIGDYISAVSLGTKASSMTGKSADGFVAGGFAAFVQVITGEQPTLVQLPDKKAKIVLTEKQALTMRKWLDGQLWAAVKKPSAEQTLTLEMNPVVVPWALKYLVPVALAFVVVGWVGHYYLAR